MNSMKQSRCTPDLPMIKSLHDMWKEMIDQEMEKLETSYVKIETLEYLIRTQGDTPAPLHTQANAIIYSTNFNRTIKIN